MSAQGSGDKSQRRAERMPLLRALRHRNFRLFYLGMATSLVGMWVQVTALAWLVYRLTDSAWLVGVLALAQQAPSLVLGPVAGAYADRLNRRNVLVACMSLALVPALTLGVLTLGGWVAPWHIISLAFVAGVARAFEIPTRHALLPQLVDRDDLSNAIALNSALFNGARLIGPAIAGVLIPTVGEGWCFVVNAASFVFVIAALLVIPASATTPSERKGARGSVWSDIREGLAYAASQPVVRALLGSLVVVSFAAMPYSVLLPSFAERQLQGGPQTYSLLQIAVGVGSLLGALRLAARVSAAGLERWVPTASVLIGVCLIALSWARSLWLALLLLTLQGLVFMLALASSNTMMQSLAPDELRGRLMSLHSTIFLGVFPFAGIVAGALADRVGEAAVLMTCGILAIVGCAYFGQRLWREGGAALTAKDAA